MLRKTRHRRLYQQQMKVCVGSVDDDSSAGQSGIIWELEKVTKKIRHIQMEIHVLQLQLQIITSERVVTALKKSKHNSPNRFDDTALL